MTKLLFTLLTLAVGIGMSTQAAVNGALGRKVGIIEGAFVSFLIGTVSLFLLLMFFGKGNIIEVFSVPKWQLFGGLLGAAYIAITIMTVPKLGVGLVVVSVIVGQILMSMTIDHFGWFGVPRTPFDGQRMLGVLFLLVALFLIFRSNIKF
jgi:transporter family-2 protein